MIAAIDLRRWLQPTSPERTGEALSEPIYWQGPSCWAGTRE
jgi:hypothetical protein